MAQAYVCMKISEYPLAPGTETLIRWTFLGWTTYEESKQRFQRKSHVLLNKEGPTVRSYLCLSTKFEVSADLTVIESYKGFGIYLSSLS